MKPQARYEVIRAVLPALAGAVLTAVLWFAADWAYESYCPDFWFFGRMRIGFVPGWYWEWEGQWWVWTDWNHFLTWAMACAFFAAGPLVAFLFSRSRAAYIFSTALLLCVLTQGCHDVVTLWNSTGSVPLTLSEMARWYWWSFAWVFALSLGGAVVGIALQRIVRAVARGADRRKAPTRT